MRAVKELPISSRREARLMQLLEHPSLPQMIDYAERNEFCYVIMEYIRGRSLKQYLEKGYSFSPDEILYIGRTVINVLEYLHNRKPAIFYGDLKPDNLIMTDRGMLYLVDFGSAVFEYGIGSGRLKGTPGYAAPEQYHGKVGAGSDYYSLGRTLESLCGRKKWKYFLQCPGLFQFVRKCCRREPGRRWKDGGDLRASFERIHVIRITGMHVLTVITVIAVMIILLAGAGAGRSEKKLPDISTVLTPIMAKYYSLEYITGSRRQREAVCMRVEDKLQRMQAVYRESADRIHILELLSYNGELQDRADRSEVYYQQILTYEPEYTKAYLAYGRFLCRQTRYEESRNVYKQWSETISKDEKNETAEFVKEWNAWKKEAGIILGRNNGSFIQANKKQSR